MHRLIPALCTATLLSACQAVSYQPSPADRKVAFPLLPCEESGRLQEARKQLTSAPLASRAGEDLTFSDQWVCVTTPDMRDVDDAGPETRARVALVDPNELALRNELEQDFVASPTGSRAFLGIALSGGGSKAGAFGIGVLAGLADSDLLDTADFISTVSGGSYSAYYYYTHRVLPGARGKGGDKRNPEVTSKELFWDCVQRPGPDLMDAQLRERLGARGACDLGGLRPSLTPATKLPYFDAHYQAYLRCQQDVFNPGMCSTNPDIGRIGGGISPITLAGTIALIPAGLIGNVLFDWGINTSQAGRTYARGIGMAYGTTLTKGSALPSSAPLENTTSIPGQPASYVSTKIRCDKPDNDDGYALDCTRGAFLDSAVPLTYPELRTALLEGRKIGGAPLPFWIINATGPRFRSFFGWWAPAVDDISNLDMFEMTAVSHGSARFGYVSAPMSLHDMTVLDAVTASAAFADSSQLSITNRIGKGLIGVGLRLTNFDWGADISNYNVPDRRRSLHKALPIPFYWTDSFFDNTFGPNSKRQTFKDRTHSAFIRLIDGGNSENLGVYALMKRKVQTIVLADSAADTNGHFKDICAFSFRLKNNPDGFPTKLYIPGLKNFHTHCDELLEKTGSQARSYPIREWKFNFPVLMACMRTAAPVDLAKPCEGLDPQTDSRVLIVKPAIDLESVIAKQTVMRLGAMSKRSIISCLLPHEVADGKMVPLLNCDATAFVLAAWVDEDGACQKFPQHATASTTLNSSSTLFSAYRELGRQYIMQAKQVLDELAQGKDELFRVVAEQQGNHPLANKPLSTVEDKMTCDGKVRPPWLTAVSAQ